jgi:hypothetical protein
MEAIEFKTTIKDNRIEIPEQYRDRLSRSVRVILVNEQQQSDIIDRLLRQPLKAKDFRPLSREEAHARK